MSVTAFNLDTHWAGHVATGLSIFVALFFFLTAAIGAHKLTLRKELIVKIPPVSFVDRG